MFLFWSLFQSPLPEATPTEFDRRILPDSVGFGRIQSNSVRIGQIWSDFDSWLIWSELIGIGRILSDSVGFGRIWSDSVGFGQIWSDSVGFGRIWSELVRFGWILNPG